MGLEGSTNSADGGCRMRRATAVRRRRASKAMTLEELEDWIDRLDPPPLVDGVSMLDGYMAAIIVGPCSISPYEWMEHMLGAHGDIGMDGSTQAAAMMGVVARFNAVSEGLAVRFIDIISPDRAVCGFDGQRVALPTTPQPQQPHQ